MGIKRNKNWVLLPNTPALVALKMITGIKEISTT